MNDVMDAWRWPLGKAMALQQSNPTDFNNSICHVNRIHRSQRSAVVDSQPLAQGLSLEFRIYRKFAINIVTRCGDGVAVC